MTEDANTGASLIGIAEIIIAKHRNGAIGDVRLRFQKEYARFANIDKSGSDNNRPSEIQSAMNNELPPAAAPGNTSVNNEPLPF
jgi:replicative DNA helicase